MYLFDTDHMSLIEHGGAEFERLRQEGVRIGTMDLKIAAIALANDAPVITRNTQDFARVPNLLLVSGVMGLPLQ